MFNRLISQNRFTRKHIKNLTGKAPDKSIIVVGNNIPRKRVESLILDDQSFIIQGPSCVGKLTSVISICDEYDINFHISYDGSGFGITPTVSDDLFIIRYVKSNILFKEYVESGAKIVFLCEDKIPSYKIPIVKYISLNINDLKRYRELKGEDLYLWKHGEDELNTRQIITKSIRRGIPADMYPEYMPVWIARNFYKNESFLRVCILANKTKDRFYRWGLMRMIKYPRPIELKYPERIKYDS